MAHIIAKHWAPWMPHEAPSPSINPPRGLPEGEPAR